MTNATIRRLINNQKAEHSPHAFRAGGAGMADFNRLYPALRRLPAKEIAGWMQAIDAMRTTHGECVACACKILAYQRLITRDRLPKTSARYAALYADLYRYDSTGRDFLAEVRASLLGDPDGAAAEYHKRGWRQLALELALDHGFYRP
jgi:hypothetical protein